MNAARDMSPTVSAATVARGLPLPLASLRARVAAATEPDRGLDALLHIAAGKPPAWASPEDKLVLARAYKHDPGPRVALNSKDGPGIDAPRYTASQDAAFALIGERLDGFWRLHLTAQDGIAHATIITRDSEYRANDARTPALAMLGALLAALDE